MPAIKKAYISAAKALDPILRIFDTIVGLPFEGVWLRREHGILTEVLMKFGEKFLAAAAEPDYDMLLLEARSQPDLRGMTEAFQRMPWASFGSQPFGWGWLTVNKQGYTDGALLGFGEGIYPQLVLNVMASEVKVGAIEWHG